MEVVHRTTRAMACQFEAWLAGDDAAHLAAVADALWAEIDRVQRLISRFDPRTEIARLNRQAAAGPVLVDVEMLALLLDCRRWWELTGGWFDIAAGSRVDTGDRSAANRRPSMADVEINALDRTVVFRHPAAQLDLGGFGKGYALECLRPLLAEYRVTSALIHGGTSSVLAVGNSPDGGPWPVAIHAPWQPPPDRAGDSMRAEVLLADVALSCSAIRHAADDPSDLIDPRTGRRLEGLAACVVIDDTATAAEALSTGLLCMGRHEAQAFVAAHADALRAVGWIEQAGTTTEISWWPDRPTA